MVKLHKGFCNYLSALQCLNACLIEYVSRGYLCSAYTDIKTSSFELSVHYREPDYPSVIKGLEPSSYKRDMYKDSTNGSFSVMHLYFGIADEKEVDL